MSFRNISVVMSATSGNLRSEMIAAGRSVDMFSAKVKEANGTMSETSGIWRTTGITIGAAVVVGLGLATVAAAKFEKQMRNVNSIARMSEPAFEDMRQSVLDLSKTVPQSAGTLAESLYEIVSSGFKGSDALDVLKASAMAASAGLTDADTATKGIVTVLNSYGVGAGRAADVSDILFKTVDVGIVRFEELSQHIGDFSGIAAQMGVTLVDATAAFAGMTLAGVPAASAGMSLSRVLQSLLKPSAALKTEMSTLGLSLDSLKDPAIGLHGVIEQLRVASQGNVQVLQQWFPNVRALRGVLALTTADGANYNRAFDGIADSTSRAGATQKAFNEQMKSASNQFTLFKNNIMASAINIGQSLLPRLLQMLDLLSRAGSNAIPMFMSAWQALQPLFLSLGRVIENTGNIISDLADSLGPVVSLFAQIGGGALLGTLMAFAKALESVTGFLHENKAVATGLAVLLAGQFVTSLLAAASAEGILMASMKLPLLGSAVTMVTKWIQSINLATKINMFSGMTEGAARWAAVSDTVVSAFGKIGAALTGTTGAVAVFLLLAKTQIDAFNNAKKAGEDYGNAIIKLTDHNDFSSMTAGIDKIKTKMVELQAVSKSQNNPWGWARGFLDLTIPFQDMGNTIVDANRGMEGLSQSTEKFQGEVAKVKVIAGDIGLAPDKVVKYINALNLDIDTMPYQQVAARVKDADSAARSGSVSISMLSDALGTLADDTASADDVLKAYNQTIDATIGLALGAFDAETAWAKSLTGLSDSLKTNGRDLNAFSKAGQDNRAAFSSFAEDSIKRAKATALANGSISDGNAILMESVGALTSVMKQAGYTDDEIAALSVQLGLTPDNLRILVQAEGTDSAQKALDDVKDKADVLAGINPRVNVTAQTEAASRALAGIIDQLALIDRHAANEAGKQAAHNDVAGAAATANAYIPRASGGHVIPRQTYLVGEKGPELVQFFGSGVVLPAHHAASKRAAKAMAFGGFFDQRMATGAAAGAADAAKAASSDINAKDATKAAEAAAKDAKDIQDKILKDLEDFLTKMGKAEDTQYEVGAMSRDRYLELLNQRLAGTEQYSDAWKDSWDKIQSIYSEIAAEDKARLDDMVSRQKDAFSKLDSALTAEANIRKQAGDAQIAYAKKVADIEAQFTKAQADAIKQRGVALASWTDLNTKTAVTWGNTAAALTSNIQDQINQFKQWTQELAKARSMGLSEDTIKSLGLDKSPAALGQLLMLNKASGEQIGALNAAVATSQTIATGQAAAEATQSFGDLHDTLAAIADDHATQIQAASDDFLAQQKDFNDQLAQVGNDGGRSYTQAIADGMNSALPAVQVAAQALQSLLNSGVQTTFDIFKPLEQQQNFLRAIGYDIFKPYNEQSLDVQKMTYGLYDSGGILPPGLTVAQNLTGRNEYIHTEDQLRELTAGSGGGGAPNVLVMIGGQIIKDAVQVVTKESDIKRFIGGKHK